MDVSVVTPAATRLKKIDDGPQTPAAKLQQAALKCVRGQVSLPDLEREAQALLDLRPTLPLAKRQGIRNELQSVVLNLGIVAASSPEVMRIVKSVFHGFSS
jgi:hypothetical protein